MNNGRKVVDHEGNTWLYDDLEEPFFLQDKQIVFAFLLASPHTEQLPESLEDRFSLLEVKGMVPEPVKYCVPPSPIESYDQYLDILINNKENSSISGPGDNICYLKEGEWVFEKYDGEISKLSYEEGIKLFVKCFRAFLKLVEREELGNWEDINKFRSNKDWLMEFSDKLVRLEERLDT